MYSQTLALMYSIVQIVRKICEVIENNLPVIVSSSHGTKIAISVLLLSKKLYRYKQ